MHNVITGLVEQAAGSFNGAAHHHLSIFMLGNACNAIDKETSARLAFVDERSNERMQLIFVVLDQHAASVNSEFHGFKRGKGSRPVDLPTIEQEGPVSRACYKALQLPELLLHELPGPLALSAGPHQSVGLVVHNAVASAVYVPFCLKLPHALAGAIRAIDANDVLTVFHGQSHVEQKLVERSCLVAAPGAREIGTVVLKSANGGNHGEKQWLVISLGRKWKALRFPFHQ